LDERGRAAGCLVLEEAKFLAESKFWVDMRIGKKYSYKIAPGSKERGERKKKLTNV
jgi:hypothetical protein